MNAAPDSRIARFLADRAYEISARWEQVSENLRAGCRERRMVRWVTGKIRDWEQRDDQRIELMRSDVPVRKLPVLAGDAPSSAYTRAARGGF